jgi:hypothetical protein
MDGTDNETLPPRFSHEQKLGIALLLIFALISVALGALQIRNRLYAPFALTSAVPGSLKDEVNSPEALRFRDTDFDGLNDFDELYVYQTSPYLKDTDSDGVGDKQEIEKGSNPICPAGQQCDNPIVSGEGNVSVSATSTLVEPRPLDALETGDIRSVLSDPAQVRSLLISAGLDEALIKSMSDKELLAMAAAAYASSSVKGSSNP